MPRHIASPIVVSAAGEPPKTIREYVGRANTGSDELSLAYMKSPSGWFEPGQRPEFTEYTLVLRGTLHVGTQENEVLRVGAGEALIVEAGEWVQYSTPGPEGAEYIAVCAPAFSPETVHRDD
jgi:mannose-6-phosphate isomerase-like protein (cupin superfamily)